MDDVTEAGDAKQLIRCTPPIMSDALRTSRATLHRAFQVPLPFTLKSLSQALTMLAQSL